MCLLITYPIHIKFYLFLLERVAICLLIRGYETCKNMFLKCPSDKISEGGFVDPECQPFPSHLDVYKAECSFCLNQ